MRDINSPGISRYPARGGMFIVRQNPYLRRRSEERERSCVLKVLAGSRSSERRRGGAWVVTINMQLLTE
jgi:hypothetical protein